MRGSTSAGVRLGQQPAVHRDLALRGDDVPLVRGVDHRRRQREREERLDERGEHRVESRGAFERLVERRRLSEERLQQTLRLRDQFAGRLVGAECLEVARRLDERVVRDAGHRGVPAPPVHPHGERRGHLLCGRAQVDGRLSDEETLPRALVDRVVAPNRIRMLATEPHEPVAVVAADLLVGGGDEQQVTRGLEPLAHERRERDGSGGDLVLHVERAASPDLAVDEFARPWVAIPLAGIREHGVRVAEERQRRPVATLEPRDEIRPLRHSRVELGLDPAAPAR